VCRVDPAGRVAADAYHVRLGLAPQQFVRVVLVRADEHDRARDVRGLVQPEDA
jgi:hypothetical protein